MSKAKTPAIAKISDVGAGTPANAASGADPAPAGGGTARAAVGRELPPPMALSLQGGESVVLTADQVFADKVRVKKGERGLALYPSSQAAAWVVRFSRLGSKLRVIPERLLALAEE